MLVGLLLMLLTAIEVHNKVMTFCKDTVEEDGSDYADDQPHGVGIYEVSKY